MRIFVAVFPTPSVARLLDAIPHGPDDAVRWYESGKLHVTLSFIGDHPGKEHFVGVLAWELARGMRTLPGGTVSAVAGPATAALGRRSLVVPVDGVDELARVCHDAARRAGAPGRSERFQGHLTVARHRSISELRRLEGQPFQASWEVDSVSIVTSSVSDHGSTYTSLVSVPIRRGPSSADRAVDDDERR